MQKNHDHFTKSYERILEYTHRHFFKLISVNPQFKFFRSLKCLWLHMLHKTSSIKVFGGYPFLCNHSTLVENQDLMKMCFGPLAEAQGFNWRGDVVGDVENSLLGFFNRFLFLCYKGKLNG